MSIIQNIRDKAAWIIIGAIALALIAFVVQDGFRSQSLFSGSDNSVGVINGTKVDAIEFQQRINAAEEQYRTAGYPLNDMMRQNIRESLWNEYVENAIMNDHYDELGIGVSDKELSDILYGANPPQDLRQQFTDPKTGQYDANAAYQQIQALRKQKTSPMYASFFNQYLPALVKSRQKEKYISLISNSTYVPRWMVERVNSDMSQQASISYVTVPYITISDSSVKVSDDEINAYVGKHKDEFKQERARTIEYVTFDAAPSKADSNLVLQQLQAVKDEFATTTDVASFVTRTGSETPFYDAFIAKSKIQVPNADTITSLSDGALYGPYIDNNNYVLAKMIGKRTIPDSVKVRHILISTSPSAQGLPGLADSIAKKRIDSIVTAIRNGASFDSMAIKYSDDEGSKDKGGIFEATSLQFPNLSKEFAEVAFYGNAGDKQVVKVSNARYSGYHYIEVLTQKNFEPAYKIAYVSKPILASDETMNAAMGLASQVAAEARNRAQFDAIAKKRNLNKFTAAEIKPLESNISGLGSSRELVKWMFDAKVGDVSDRPFLVGDKYVVPALIASYEEGTVPAELARAAVEPIVRNEKKATQITAKISKGATLESIGQTFNQQVAVSDSVLFNSPFIPNVGQEHKVVGAAFAKNNLNKVSEPIAGNSGVFVIRTNKIGAVANPSFDAVQQQASMQEFQQRTFSDPRLILDILKKDVKIKDNRYKFF
jgi:peptidyl-prolyl cis-trans isomerase D